MAELTHRQKELIAVLRFRASGEHDPERQVCWLGRGANGRHLLVVPTMMGTWEGLWWVNGSTLATLEGQGWIERGAEVELPAYIPRRRVATGCTVRLLAETEDPQ